MNKSKKGQILSRGDMNDQASFVYYATLQFYYEFNVKLKKAMDDINDQLG